MIANASDLLNRNIFIEHNDGALLWIYVAAIARIEYGRLKRIAATGGVVGIGYWEGAVCDPSIPAIVKAIRYAVDQVGVAHVALGSDFNGATRTPFDVTGLPQLTEGFQKAGFSADDIRAIMGGNVQRLLLAQLPAL